jgi:hypothetical protein
VVDDYELSVRFAHARHFFDELRRIRDDGDDVKGGYEVERIVFEIHLHRVHLPEFDVGVAFRISFGVRVIEHFLGQVDSDDVAMWRICVEGKTGPYADLEDTGTWRDA